MHENVFGRVIFFDQGLCGSHGVEEFASAWLQVTAKSSGLWRAGFKCSVARLFLGFWCRECQTKRFSACHVFVDSLSVFHTESVHVLMVMLDPGLRARVCPFRCNSVILLLVVACLVEMTGSSRIMMSHMYTSCRCIHITNEKLRHHRRPASPLSSPSPPSPLPPRPAPPR